jgi:hypothetical protein
VHGQSNTLHQEKNRAIHYTRRPEQYTTPGGSTTLGGQSNTLHQEENQFLANSTSAHAHACTHAHAHARAHTDTYVHAHTHAHTHSHTHRHVHAHTQTCTCTHTDTYMHTHKTARRYTHTLTTLMKVYFNREIVSPTLILMSRSTWSAKILSASILASSTSLRMSSVCRSFASTCTHKMRGIALSR